MWSSLKLLHKMHNQRIVRKSYPNLNKFTLPLISISKDLFATFFTDHIKNFRWQCTFETLDCQDSVVQCSVSTPLRPLRSLSVPTAWQARRTRDGMLWQFCDVTDTFSSPRRVNIWWRSLSSTGLSSVHCFIIFCSGNCNQRGIIFLFKVRKLSHA